MAEAMKLAVDAGRLAYLAGRIPREAVRDREQPDRRAGRPVNERADEPGRSRGARRRSATPPTATTTRR